MPSSTSSQVGHVNSLKRLCVIVSDQFILYELVNFTATLGDWRGRRKATTCFESAKCRKSLAMSVKSECGMRPT